jgi:hypothetical protein
MTFPSSFFYFNGFFIGTVFAFQECGITDKGLCNGHGHCYYDVALKQPYCYCNTGYSGTSCSQKTSSTEGYSHLHAEVAIMIFLLIIAVVLVGFVGFLAYRVTEFRKQQAYSHLPRGGDMELTDRQFS